MWGRIKTVNDIVVHRCGAELKQKVVVWCTDVGQS